MCTILTCLYLTLNIGAMDHIGEPAPTNYNVYYRNHYIGDVQIQRYRERDITDRNGALGIVELGTEHSVNRWLSVNVLVRHQSFMSTGRDRGENIVAGGFKIMPFR